MGGQSGFGIVSELKPSHGFVVVLGGSVNSTWWWSSRERHVVMWISDARAEKAADRHH